jgi:hypothetical protein
LQRFFPSLLQINLTRPTEELGGIGQDLLDEEKKNYCGGEKKSFGAKYKSGIRNRTEQPQRQQPQQKQRQLQQLRQQQGRQQQQHPPQQNGSRIHRRLGPDADLGGGHLRGGQAPCQSGHRRGLRHEGGGPQEPARPSGTNAIKLLCRR